MKPDLALNLSFDGISLLERTTAGWVSLGQAALDADLDTEMTALHRAALTSGAATDAVKLVIPNDQIKYLECPAEDGDAEPRVREALTGATPYTLDELCCDWSTKAGKTLIAAVARETLDEAEAFAKSHGFRPVCFVAMPQRRKFKGEPFFGPAASWDGPPPERDAFLIRIVETSLDSPDPEPSDPGRTATAPSAPAPAAAETGQTAPHPAQDDAGAKDGATTPRPAPVTPGAQSPAALHRPAERASQAVGTAEPLPEPVAAAGPARADVPAAQATTRDTGIAPAPAATPQTRAPTPAFASVRARRADGPAPRPPAEPVLRASTEAPAPPRAGIAGRAAPDRGDAARGTSPPPSVPEPAPRAGAAERDAKGGNGATPAVHAAALAAAPLPGERDTDADPATADAPLRSFDRPARAAPPTGADGDGGPASRPEDDSRGFAVFNRGSRRPGGAPEARSPAAGRTASSASARAPDVSARTRIAALRPGREPDPRAEDRDPRAHAAPRPSSAAAGGAAMALDPEDERQRMTIFGQRDRDAPQVGGKPRFLGLVLTAALILLLAGVAAWASVFLDDGFARFFRGEDRAVAGADGGLPPEALPPGTGIAETEDGGDVPDGAEEIAALETRAPDTAAVIEEARTPDARDDAFTLSSEAAEATYAATGIWQRVPTAPLELSGSELDDVYLASLDPDVVGHDAVALPEPNAEVADSPYRSPMPPAPAGTVFDLDARGLVKATPEGALNPDRVRVYLGPPPAVPPRRAAVIPDGTTGETAEDIERLQRLGGTRPRTRPVNLVENSERAALGGVSLSELAGMRPLLRPETAKAEAERDTTATARAVQDSKTPIPRPRNFQSIVEAARARAPDPEPTRVAAAAQVAPRTVAPNVPSNASVSSSATVRNALNLRRVNLIGVYGQPSSRRALVRLSNGRYQKVKVGDRIDGGRVAAIGESELRYVKGGRSVMLEMP